MERSAGYYQREACQKAGDKGSSAKWEVRLPIGVESGSFLAIFNGSPSSPIAYNASAMAFQSIMEDIDSIGEGNISVSGIKKGPYVIEAIGEMAFQEIPEDTLSTDGSLLDPVMNPTVRMITPGVPFKYFSNSVKYWDDLIGIDNINLRVLKMALLIAKLILAENTDKVPRRERDYQIGSPFANMQSIVNGLENEIAAMESEFISAGYGQTYSSKIKRTTPNGLPYGTLLPDRGCCGERRRR